MAGREGLLAVRGRIDRLDRSMETVLFERGAGEDFAVEEVVRGIISWVGSAGDQALRELAQMHDGVRLQALEVAPDAMRAALDALDPEVRVALEGAARNIARFHEAQLPAPLVVEMGPDLRLGRRAEPLARVGVYAPGGRAAYPSSVLMGAVPAKVAGVGEVILCSPPDASGAPPQAVLAAAAIAGVDRVFALGGAGAIAAMALGTESVPRVDKIVGPGNAYVTEAKLQLAGKVGTDCPAGPSEILIIADETARPEWIAREMIAQAEHDPAASAVLVSTSGRVADEAERCLSRLIAKEPRQDIIARALATRGGILLASSLEEALDFSARYAPEHLSLMVRDPHSLLPRVRNAGTVFLGGCSSVAFGDYVTGANHVLPTAGLGRLHSGLSTLDFLRFTTWQEVGPPALGELAQRAAILATAEGLPGHAAAARARLDAAAEGPGAEPGRAALSSPVGPREETSVGRSEGRPAVQARRIFDALDCYDPGRRPVALDLSDNTSLFGIPPAARRALETMRPEQVSRYPDVYARDLKEALAALHQVRPENIATGCGSDDVIDSTFRAFCDPGDRVVYEDPTFGMIPLFARMNAALPVPVPTRPGFETDPEALLAADGTITYLCSPNNPTGLCLDAEVMDFLLRRTRGLLLVDEAYADFAGESWARWAVQSERMVVLRTLSKAWGLAGLRVGYAVGPAPLIRAIEKSRGPYKINAAAEAAALAALTEDRGWHEEVVRATLLSREQLAAALGSLGLETWPSRANFLLLRVPGPRGAATARPFAAALRARGVAVRPFPALPHAGDCVRVSVGPWPMMETFLQALEQVLSDGQGSLPAQVAR